MSLVIETPAALMSIQDLGRTGYARFGMPESGPMDWWAHRAANRLTGNSPKVACLEVGFSSATLHTNEDVILAACGAGFRVWVNQCQIPLWMTFFVQKGSLVTLEKVAGGNWVYLAASGGLETPIWLSSHSTNLRAGLGKRFKKGDVLSVGPIKKQAIALAGRFLPANCRPSYKSTPLLRAIPGPHTSLFTPESREGFWEREYLVTSRSDRMGYRLAGDALQHIHGADLISQGMALGEIQVPGDGQLIVMMPDHPTTGGYTSIATVSRCDLPLLAQAPFGEARVRFELITASEAQGLLRETVKQIDDGIQFPEEEWLAW